MGGSYGSPVAQGVPAVMVLCQPQAFLLSWGPDRIGGSFCGFGFCMRTSDFDYVLPPELIATHPVDHRDQSRLLHVDRAGGDLSHRVFSDLLNLLRPGDLLVMNDSKVIRARLRGKRRSTGAGVEALLLERVGSEAGLSGSMWRAICRPARKFKVGEWVDFGDGALAAMVDGEGADGERLLKFGSDDILPLLEQFGEIPLPPYIVQRRKETGIRAEAVDDSSRYQTVYSDKAGSVAAPTAGLHFTTELLQRLSEKGVAHARVTLHVGAGTFKPVEVDNPADHPIHSEVCEVPEAAAGAIMECRKRGGRVVAVGTTTTRTLEAAWDEAGGVFRRGAFSTRLLILPGYEFKVIDGMITNFHLPRSSLLMLVSAFAGREAVMKAYQVAVEEGYRFYSYGDAMLLI